MRRALACAALALVIAGCGGGTKTVTTRVEVPRPATTAAKSGGFDPQAIYKTDAPGVVTLIAIEGSGGQNLFGRSSQALGSGFVVDADGYVVTNAHVVTGDSGKKAADVFVAFADGNKVDGKVVGTDPDSDIALVKINPSELQDGKLVALPLGSTSELQVGEPVAAIGSPFGEEQSLSLGVVSALNRDIRSLTSFRIGNAIQTDAAINHGNSGGPLLDADGKVIGVNSQIQSTGGGGEGVGFAVPIETVKRSIDQLRKKGRVDYAYLGIESVSLYPQLAKRLGIDRPTGVLIDEVDRGGPADTAGLRGARSHINFQNVRGIPVGGDLIVAVDGRKLTRAEDLSDVIGPHRPGDRIPVRIIRRGAERTVQVTLGTRPNRQAGAR